MVRALEDEPLRADLKVKGLALGQAILLGAGCRKDRGTVPGVVRGEQPSR